MRGALLWIGEIMSAASICLQPLSFLSKVEEYNILLLTIYIALRGTSDPLLSFQWCIISMDIKNGDYDSNYFAAIPSPFDPVS